MITVCLLQTSFRIGGAERLWVQLTERLNRQRFRPVVCCLYEPGSFGEQLRRAGIPVYAHLAGSRFDFRAVVRLVSFLRRERVDVLYMVNQPLVQLWGTVCGRLARIPTLITMVQSTGKVSRIRRRLWINRLTFPFVNQITAVGEMHKRYLCEQEGIDPCKISIIPNGVEADRFAVGAAKQTRERLGITDAAPVVGIVAMLRPEKAHGVFLEAAARVIERVPTAQFLVVGDGPERLWLEALAKTLGISEHTHFLGARKDIPKILGVLDVGVISSYSVVETLSVSALEYMAAGKPVVSTHVGSMPELIEEGETGFLVNPGDSEALADRIVRLLQDCALAQRLGRAGREKVARHYTNEQVVKRTEDLFEYLLDHRNGKRRKAR